MVPIIIKEQLQLIINGFEFIWAAIGSTTASHLQSEHGITPTFTSKYPSPQGFWESFQEHFL